MDIREISKIKISENILGEIYNENLKYKEELNKKIETGKIKIENSKKKSYDEILNKYFNLLPSKMICYINEDKNNFFLVEKMGKNFNFEYKKSRVDVYFSKDKFLYETENENGKKINNNIYAIEVGEGETEENKKYKFLINFSESKKEFLIKYFKKDIEIEHIILYKEIEKLKNKLKYKETPLFEYNNGIFSLAKNYSKSLLEEMISDKLREELSIDNFENKEKMVTYVLNNFIEEMISEEKIKKDIHKLREELSIDNFENEEKMMTYVLNNFIEEMNSVDKKFDNLYQEINCIKEEIKKIDEKLKENIKIEDINNCFDSYITKDLKRFNGETYETQIYDTNKGNWDIFEDLNESNILHIGENALEEFTLNKFIYARNPKYDIVQSGVVGIDFGTKSTVVVSYRDDNNGINGSKTLPIRISGNDGGIEMSENYENATIIHFNKIENFIKDYNSNIGRPYTNYSDIQISLEAENILKQNLGNFDINKFMLDLKQWASSKNKKKKIRDKNRDLYTIEGYLDLKENDFDPIEIYAYYIGCKINNMAQYSIYLEYYLSFPVTYELEVKNKILNSFTKGIKKSLPKSILNDEEIMKKFRVVFGASEPASYAITALKKFYVEPEIGNDIGYAVFDFGGGTTDFSYGIYREKENSKKYDYEIQELESGGDKYLGGENLLSLVAFDVFLQNRKKLVNENYNICLPENKKQEIGFESFLSFSNEAEFNMRKLMEAMRNYWEGKIDEEERNKKKITVYLANKFGGENGYKNEELDVDYERLDKILQDNIYNGIMAFLEKFKKVFNDKNLSEIYVFLAGNSSKSKFVEEIFNSELTQDFIEKYNIKLKNAYAIEEEDSGVIGLNSKTGVAFGLVELREGNGEIEYIPYSKNENNEINFKYCLGYSKKRRFIPVIKFDTPYNEWIKYDDVENETIIEILYSGNMRAEGNQFPASECSRLRILIEKNSKGGLYIRLKNPTTIEYVICEDINNFDKNKITTQILN